MLNKTMMSFVILFLKGSGFREKMRPTPLDFIFPEILISNGGNLAYINDKLNKLLDHLNMITHIKVKHC